MTLKGAISGLSQIFRGLSYKENHKTGYAYRENSLEIRGNTLGI
jgi:hypothetical protein